MTSEVTRNDCGGNTERLQSSCGATAELLRSCCGAAELLRNCCGAAAELLQNCCGNSCGMAVRPPLGQRSPQPFEPARAFPPLSATVEPKIENFPIHQITLEPPRGSKPLRERVPPLYIVVTPVSRDAGASSDQSP